MNAVKCHNMDVEHVVYLAEIQRKSEKAREVWKKYCISFEKILPHPHTVSSMLHLVQRPISRISKVRSCYPKMLLKWVQKCFSISAPSGKALALAFSVPDMSFVFWQHSFCSWLPAQICKTTLEEILPLL